MQGTDFLVENFMQHSRLILHHTQAASARTRFVRMPHGGVSAFDALPVRAELLDQAPADSVVNHPAKLINDAEQRLGLKPGSLEVDSSFQAWVDVAQGPIQVFLARFTSIDPPFAEVENLGGEFINLTDGRQLAQVELEMLRRAYECVMGS
jgi:hypothetical protein